MEYDEQTLEYIRQMETDREKLKMDSANLQNNYGQLSMYQSINPSNLAEIQLDLSKEKSLIEHVLRAHALKREENGRENWIETKDPSRKIFTEYGVDRLMNFINMYISLNIILSYYLPEEVMAKMKIISDELADIFYLEYEYLFYKPLVKEMFEFEGYDEKDIFVMNTPQLIKFHNDMNFKCEMLYSKNKKQIYMIHNMLTNAVHSAYNRALWGKERDSLRKMMHISESNQPRSGTMPQQSSTSKFKWYNPNSW